MSDFVCPDGAKAIPLSRGMFAIVDETDHEWLSQWRWTTLASNDGQRFYAFRWEFHQEGGKKKQTMVLMHRAITEAPKGMVVDHINRNGLDNRRQNIRVATQTQNMMNRTKNRNNSSGINGLSWVQPTKRTRGYWRVQLVIERKAVGIGSFQDEKEARLAAREANILREIVAFL